MPIDLRTKEQATFDTPQSAAADSIAAKLALEGELLWSGTYQGAAANLNRPAINFVTEGTWGVTAAVGFALLSHSYKNFAPIATKVLTTGMIVDLANRTMATTYAMTSTWTNPERLNENKKIVANALGNGLVEYGLLGLPGFYALKHTTSYLDLSKTKLDSTFAASAENLSLIPMLKLDWLLNVRPTLKKVDPSDALATFYREQSQSTVRLAVSQVSKRATSKGSGSGFFVHQEGLVATSYHVPKGKNKITVITASGEEFAANLIARDRGADLAILKITNIPEGKKFPVATLAASSDIAPGSPLFILGHPKGTETIVLSQGTFFKHTRLDREEALQGNFKPKEFKDNYLTAGIAILKAKIPHLDANSGSAIRSGNGEVIGILSHGTDAIGGGANLDHIKELLRITKELNPSHGWLEVKTSARASIGNDAAGQRIGSTIHPIEISSTAVLRTRVELAQKLNSAHFDKLVNKELGSKPNQPHPDRPDNPAHTAVKLAGTSLAIDDINRLFSDSKN